MAPSLRCPYCSYPGYLTLDQWIRHLEQIHGISRLRAELLFYEILRTLREG